MKKLIKKLINGETINIERKQFTAFLLEAGKQLEEHKFNIDYSEEDFVILEKAF